MQEERKRKRILKGVEIALIALFCALVLLLDFVEIPFSSDEFRRRTLTAIVRQGVGSGIATWCVLRLKIRLFGRVENWLYLLPCLLVAVDNFQWYAYFSGKMQLVRTEWVDAFLFLTSCLFAALFEEVVFRGILFALLLSVFQKTKKGLWATVALSSLIFGLAHLLNGFSLGTLVQVAYTTLTGGLFAFCFVKTKNILCCAFVHAVYNACGGLFGVDGLGAGVVFDLGTVVTMLIVSVLVGVFVLYELWRYSQVERETLYQKMGVEING